LFSNSCQFVGPDAPELWPRSYPNALELAEMSVDDVMNLDLEDQDINVRAYVSVVSQCPENSICELPDAFYLADRLSWTIDWGASLRVEAATPKQLRTGERRLFSISARVYSINGTKFMRYRLLGYD